MEGSRSRWCKVGPWLGLGRVVWCGMVWYGMGLSKGRERSEAVTQQRSAGTDGRGSAGIIKMSTTETIPLVRPGVRKKGSKEGGGVVGNGSIRKTRLSEVGNVGWGQKKWAALMNRTSTNRGRRELERRREQRRGYEYLGHE